MIAKFLLLGLCAVGIAQGDVNDFLKNVMDSALKKVREVAEKIEDPTNEYVQMVDNRLLALLWEHNVQQKSMNESVASAVFKGMMRNNKFANFECISNVARDTFEKISNSFKQVRNRTRLSVEKGVERVQTLGLILPGLDGFVRGYVATKNEEMKKAKDEAARLKILNEVVKKMVYLNSILRTIESQATDYKFKFFEDYVSYVFDTESYLKKTSREGAQKALKCIA